MLLVALVMKTSMSHIWGALGHFQAGSAQVLLQVREQVLLGHVDSEKISSRSQLPYYPVMLPPLGSWPGSRVRAGDYFVRYREATNEIGADA